MTRQNRHELILFIALVISLILYVLTNSFWWPVIIIFTSAFTLIGILNKVHPLKKVPK
ncbi:hypothetical protein [Weissella paramesenteroides]|uniref:hypothetical protein n=1 Tax=Weissella paramesenteroides TaxID=1249 RepID=UPI003F745916